MKRTAIHPGEHLAEQLEELGMSAAELGWQLQVPTLESRAKSPRAVAVAD